MVKIKGIEEHSIYFGASAKMLKLAGELRKNTTDAEKLLWSRINKRQVNGYKFRDNIQLIFSSLTFIAMNYIL